MPDTHFHTGFGHLEGYTSAYYTYLWSKVIAKDLFSAFDADNCAIGQRNPAELRPGSWMGGVLLEELWRYQMPERGSIARPRITN